MTRFTAVFAAPIGTNDDVTVTASRISSSNQTATGPRHTDELPRSALLEVGCVFQPFGREERDAERDEHGPEEADVRDRISKGALRVSNSAMQIEGKHRRYVFDVTDVSKCPDASIPPHIKALASEDGVTQIVWRRRE